MIPALLLCALTSMPQGTPADHLRYPPDSAVIRVAPYLDSGELPQAVSARTLGSCDFDGDGNAEVWFLGDPGPFAGAISVQMPRTSDLGRFRPYAQLAASTRTDAASYHSTASPVDFLVLTDPANDQLEYLFYLPPTSGDPRSGNWVVVDSNLQVGASSYEVETNDADGDGHDDITLLQSSSGGTTISKLHMGMSAGVFGILDTTTVTLSVFLHELRVLDLNADGRSDVLFHAPGFGAYAYIDDAAGAFVPFFALRFSGIELRDLVVGDIDRDGRDDFAMVFDIGVGLIRSHSSGFQFSALFKPSTFSNLATAAVFDAGAGGNIDLVMLPADGQALAIHPFDAATGAFGQQVIESPWQTDLANYVGPGNPGLRVLTTDLDNDGDEELVLPMPDGQHWISLRGPVVDLSPLDNIVVEDLGQSGNSTYHEQKLTVSLPDSWFTAGIPELEVAIILEDVNTLESFYWTRSFPIVDPQTKTTSFGLMFNTNKQSVQNMLATGLRLREGLMTAGGPTLISMHGKNGTQRFASRILISDGTGSGSGSEVGITWDVVAAPPSPEADADLLPWN